jgi:hypothetical protein
MTMWPRLSRAVPTMTAQVAQAAFPKGCLAMRIHYDQVNSTNSTNPRHHHDQ